jgi:antirestriction protein ArdC
MTKTERKDAYELVTNRLADAFEQGNVPWHKPWKSLGDPANLVSKKPYRGINVWLTLLSGYQSPWWVSFKQALDLGGNVRKGEKGTVVVYWSLFKKKEKQADGSVKEARIPVLRYSTVFNVEQCDGLDAKVPPAPVQTVAFGAKHDLAEILLDLWKNKPTISEGNGDRACYTPFLDRIEMPERTRFESLDAFYQTLFHEAIHATGHESRINRWKKGSDQFQFGSESYSEEELIAEIGGCFLQQVAGLDIQTDNSAAYLRNWASKLRGDKRLIIRAASAAQKAADLVQNIAPPVYNDSKDESEEAPEGASAQSEAA